MYFCRYMLRYINQFWSHLDPILKKMQQSLHSFVLNVMKGNIYGDAILLGVITKMWNVRITVVSLEYTKPWKVMHKSEGADIVLVFNGADFTARVPVTHVTSTSTYIYSNVIIIPKSSIKKKIYFEQLCNLHLCND